MVSKWVITYKWGILGLYATSVTNFLGHPSGVWGSSRCFSVFFVPEVFDGCEYLLMRIWRFFGGIRI